MVYMGCLEIEIKISMKARKFGQDCKSCEILRPVSGERVSIPREHGYLT